MNVFLNVGRVGLYGFMAWLAWAGLCQWWVPVTLVWYDVGHYLVYFKIPFTKPRKPVFPLALMPRPEDKDVQ